MRYTIRNIRAPVDQALSRLAREQGKSLQEVAVEALARGAGLTETRLRPRDLTDIAGSWRDDHEFDRAIADQHTLYSERCR